MFVFVACLQNSQFRLIKSTCIEGYIFILAFYEYIKCRSALCKNISSLRAIPTRWYL